MFKELAAVYKPAAFISPLPPEKVPSVYKRMRWQMMAGVFSGYVFYYFVRNSFSLAKPYLIKEYGLSKSDVGFIATGLAVAYGLSKFIMGNVSDRSNPRYFMATGLLLSGLVNLIFPCFVNSVALMFVMWSVNGWAQGMGWPPCARTLTHWFSDRERGTIFAFWNLAHNLGGGLVGPVVNGALALAAVAAAGAALSPALTLRLIFLVPALLALVMGVLLLLFLRDTPQSCGLPSIEDHKDDHPETGVADPEKELTAREIFVKFVLKNRPLWVIAVANVFVYVVRYGVLNWAPTYLTAAKNCPPDTSRWLFFLYEAAGIPGTLLAGWASDKLFGGRRNPVSFIFMALVTVSVWIYWKNPPGNFHVDALALGAIGFLVYGPVMLIGVSAVDLAPKKAAGTAA
ncbi:MAG TPA: phosphoglycerate transporter protein PgtP, partial [Elusimicrobiales bacterium]|nr:phosphoglycerate transporter protein PgtP [Elusimicrobiales bacterium]